MAEVAGGNDDNDDGDGAMCHLVLFFVDPSVFDTLPPSPLIWKIQNGPFFENFLLWMTTGRRSGTIGKLRGFLPCYNVEEDHLLCTNAFEQTRVFFQQTHVGIESLDVGMSTICIYIYIYI